MMTSSSELSLDCKPQSYSMLLKSFGDNTGNINHLQPPSDHLQTHNLEDYLSRLEEERLKIDAFKRELPLCMQLLTNAMEVSRQQLQSYRSSSANQGKRPILEEFIPIKHSISNSDGSSDQVQKKPNSTSDKASWMTSAQLWSQAHEGVTTKQLASPPSKEAEMGFCPGLSLLDNNKNKQRNCGAFLPFTKERNSNLINHALSDLTLASDERETEDNKGLKSESGLTTENLAKVSDSTIMAGKGMDSNDQTTVTGATTTTNSTNTTTQTHRKQRRCWSPDLHRRFVNALQMLGGSQVATPKQIRELMKVDGLTNDEVKSHLQKYRLHTRRPGPSPQAAGAPGPQLVVLGLGGIWVPPEYATATSHHHGAPPPAIYSTHPTAQVAPHYCPPIPSIPQELYPQPLPQGLPHPQIHHHQIHTFKATSQGRSSPESDGRRGARDQSESIEDGKSASSSWKGDSGDDSNEERKRKKLASMDEEISNGREITLQVLAR